VATVALIPARWASSRFPGKPLAPVAGRPMIEWVWRRCGRISGLDAVYVATDSPEIARAVEGFGGLAVMTSAEHRSGSDRLAEAAGTLGLGDGDLVINVQGDQPALDPAHPSLLVEAMEADPALPMATLAVPFGDPGEIADPNHVKVVADLSGHALYFSRAPIPWPRDGGEGGRLKHVGLYAYRAGFLRLFVSWPPGRLETIESLEQLRVLERGHRIKVLVAEGISPEVDVPADVAKAEAALLAEPGPGFGA
jgi:3-deoxy-manno-octulosonate cytidylyltransferase (CMP-KDO synthetase)